MGDVEPKRLHHYALTEEIGSGRNGTVFRAFDLEQQRAVAVKLLRNEIMADHLFRKQVMARTTTAAQIDHPNIVTVTGIERIEGQYIIVSELVEGESVVEFYSRGVKHLAVFVDIATQLVAGLHEAHSRMVVHGNIHPSNVIIDNEGVVKLTDFGLHQVPGSVNKEQGTEVLCYLSPEQLAGHPPDFTSDLYSVGLVLYEMICGFPPFVADGADDLRRAIKSDPLELEPLRERGMPGDIVLLIEKLLARRSEDRFANTEELLVTIKAIGDFETHHRQCSGKAKSVWSPRQYMMVSALVVLIVILWIIIASYQH